MSTFISDHNNKVATDPVYETTNEDSKLCEEQ